MPMSPRWRAVSLAVAGLIIGAVVGSLLLDFCPPVDQWPHHTFTPGGGNCRVLLEEIVDEALTDIENPALTPGEKLQLKQAIKLAHTCAHQDLPNHTAAQQAKHAQAVQAANTKAKLNLTANPNKWTQVVADLTIGVNHPH